MKLEKIQGIFSFSIKFSIYTLILNFAGLICFYEVGREKGDRENIMGERVIYKILTYILNKGLCMF